MFRKWQDDFKEMLKNNVQINSMAEVAKYVKRDLINGNKVRFEHLLKLYFYPEATQYHAGWMRSVYSATFQVMKLRRNNKNPDKDFIMDAVWYTEDPEDLPVKLSGMVHVLAFKLKELEEPEHPLPHDIVCDCIQYLYGYHDWLAEELSTLGYVTNTGVYDKIDKLLCNSIYKK